MPPRSRPLSTLLVGGLTVASVSFAACAPSEQPAPTVATLPPATPATPAPPPATASPATTSATPPAPTEAPSPAPSDTPPPTTTASAPSSGIVVDRAVWISAFEAALPVALCQTGSYFRSCFAITPVECEQTTASATRVCLDKVRKQLPSKFHQPDEGTACGRKIGGCVGTSFEVTLASKKIASQKCDDPSAWTAPP